MTTSELEAIILSSLKTAEINNFESIDISSLQKINFAKRTRNIFIKKAFGRPLSILIARYPAFLHKLLRSPKLEYPQAYAKLLSAMTYLYSSEDNSFYEEKASYFIDKIIKLRSPYSQYYCWGQPFRWYSRIPFPTNIPRTTVTTQVIHSLIDIYQQAPTSNLSEVISSASEYLFQQHSRIKSDQHSYFSYTLNDDFFIHNSNLKAAAALLRVGKLFSINRYESVCWSAIMASIKDQNPDGSWFYWGRPNKSLGSIDSYHTGFNLEALANIYLYSGNPIVLKSFKNGLEYFEKNLIITDSGFPKFTSKYNMPLDVQACAQTISVYLFSYQIFDDIEYYNKAYKLAERTIKKAWLPEEKRFVYKVYKNFVDPSYYLRWSDAWMILSLAKLKSICL